MSLRQQILAWVGEVRKSKFARDAVIMLVLNTSGKLFMFVGNIYAAKCLGPINLGISAQILAFSQQASIAYNGGVIKITLLENAAGKRGPPPLEKFLVHFCFVLGLITLFFFFFVLFFFFLY